MNLARRILEGIAEVELDIAPEFQLPPLGEPNVYAGPNAGWVMVDWHPEGILYGKLVQGAFRIDATMSSLFTLETSWSMIKEGFEWVGKHLDKISALVPGSEATRVYLDNVEEDEYDLAHRLMKEDIIDAFTSLESEEETSDDDFRLDNPRLDNPRVTRYSKEKGGYFWDFGAGLLVYGRLSSEYFQVDASASTAIFAGTRDEVEHVFEWFRKNLEAGTKIAIVNLESDGVDTAENLVRKGLIDEFSGSPKSKGNRDEGDLDG